MNEPQIIPSTEVDSRLFGVSVRGWLAAVLVVTICGMSSAGVEVKEPLYTLGGLAVGFYFGQKKT